MMKKIVLLFIAACILILGVYLLTASGSISHKVQIVLNFLVVLGLGCCVSLIYRHHGH